MRIGSLFAGYGGLDLGLEQALGTGTPAWFAEIDPAPSRILAHHWPTVPNLGDITTIDWTAVARYAPVDVLTGGFPCQDVSLAGLRRGLHPDTRSGLWAHFAAAIDALRPPLVIIENVRGLLSAEAHSDLEPDPWDLGTPGGTDRPPLRALGAVLGDLADLGYDAQWHGIRAADAGAPHGRFRVFIAAHPAGDGLRRRDLSPRPAGEHGQPRDADGAALEDADVAARGQRRQPAPRPAEIGRARADARGRDRAPAPDAGRVGRERRRGSGDLARLAGETQSPRDQRQRDGDAAHDRGAAAPDTAGSGWERRGPVRLGGTRDAATRIRPTGPADPDRSGRESIGRLDTVERDPHRRDRPHVAWGAYEPAIRRWEHVTGRPAPAPTELSSRDAARLSPAFVEWMMGLPPGHVTSPAIGLTRNEQLKALGNGVVPQQAALAIRTLLEVTR